MGRYEVLYKELMTMLCLREELSLLSIKGEEYAQVIAGVNEYLVAESLSLLTNAPLVIGRKVREDSPLIVWNGCVTGEGCLREFRMASGGLPDIEVLLGGGRALIVEVTLGISHGTIIEEVHEALKHMDHVGNHLQVVGALIIAPVSSGRADRINRTLSKVVRKPVKVATYYKLLSLLKGARRVSPEELINELVSGEGLKESLSKDCLRIREVLGVKGGELREVIKELISNGLTELAALIHTIVQGFPRS